MEPRLPAERISRSAVSVSLGKREVSVLWPSRSARAARSGPSYPPPPLGSNSFTSHRVRISAPSRLASER